METDRYYNRVAAAFVRGRLSIGAGVDDDELLERGRLAGLKLHHFKTTSLRRVMVVLDILQGLQPQTLLDIGAGRGAFLWPLLHAFPELPVTVFEVLEQRVRDIDSVRLGGYANLHAVVKDISSPTGESESFDIVTILEVLEHLEDPLAAATECVRRADRFVIASVPSRPDDNPEHIRLFSGETLTELFINAGAKRVSLQYVPEHNVAVVSV